MLLLTYYCRHLASACRPERVEDTVRKSDNGGTSHEKYMLRAYRRKKLDSELLLRALLADRNNGLRRHLRSFASDEESP